MKRERLLTQLIRLRELHLKSQSAHLKNRAQHLNEVRQRGEAARDAAGRSLEDARNLADLIHFGQARVHSARLAKKVETEVRALSEEVGHARKLAYVDVKEMTMRLADSGAEHYIKLSPVLGVPEAKSDEMGEKLPIVRDRIVTVVTARSSTDLSTPAGKDKLKADLMTVLHHDFHEDVVDIYFSDYLVE